MTRSLAELQQRRYRHETGDCWNGSPQHPAGLRRVHPAHAKKIQWGDTSGWCSPACLLFTGGEEATLEMTLWQKNRGNSVARRLLQFCCTKEAPTAVCE